MRESSPFLRVLVALMMTVPTVADDATTTSYTNDSSFQDDMMTATNEYRVQHDASKLEWNVTLAGYAQDWADNCDFEHSEDSRLGNCSDMSTALVLETMQGGPYGENLGSGYDSEVLTVTAWANESRKYDFEAGKFSEETGHFTQIVSKSTTSMGCGRNECNGGTGGGEGDAPGWFVVCEYWPRGNVVGQFTENVQSVPQQGTESRAAGKAIGVLMLPWIGLVTRWMVAM